MRGNQYLLCLRSAKRIADFRLVDATDLYIKNRDLKGKPVKSILLTAKKQKITKLSHGTAVLMVDSKTTFCQELHISTPFDSRPFKQLDYLNFIYFNGNVSIKPSKNLQGSFKIFCQTHLGLCLTKKFT